MRVIAYMLAYYWAGVITAIVFSLLGGTWHATVACILIGAILASYPATRIPWEDWFPPKE